MEVDEGMGEILIAGERVVPFSKSSSVGSRIEGLEDSGKHDFRRLLNFVHCRSIYPSKTRGEKGRGYA